MKYPKEKPWSERLTEAQIEDLAYNGAELPDGLNAGETLEFLMFRALYEYARAVHMEAEQGRREKRRIQRLCKRYLLDCEYVLYVGTLYRDTEQARTAYRKKPCLETANGILKALDKVSLPEYWEEDEKA